MAKKKVKKSRPKFKIPLGTAAGLAMSIMSMYDTYKYRLSGSFGGATYSKSDAFITATTGAVKRTTTTVEGAVNTWYWDSNISTSTAIAAYAPLGVGIGISKGIGGPKGLNVNNYIKAVPFVKL